MRLLLGVAFFCWELSLAFLGFQIKKTQFLVNKNRNPDALVEQEEQRLDLGFGKQLVDASTRLLNPDGSFNVSRTHQSFWAKLNIYHRLITMKWRYFWLVVGGTYLVLNLCFASLYLLVGIEHLHGADLSTPFTRFFDALFFSSQTLTTVGYGRIAPFGFWTSSIAAVESLMGLMTFALATGLLYGRFSRPKLAVLFSEKILVAPYLDTTGLMFRIINERANQLIEVGIEMILSIIEDLPDGSTTRRYFGLTLERSKVQFFPLNWTVVHPITEDSPIFGLDQATLVRRDAEFMILLRATEDTFSQVVHTRTSYHSSDMIFGAKFVKMYDSSNPGITKVDITKISDYEQIIK